MHNRNLQWILEESEKHQYDIQLEIGGKAFIRKRKGSGAHPESWLGLFTFRRFEDVPLRRYATFDTLQNLIEKAARGNIEVIVAKNPNVLSYQENEDDNGRLFAIVTPNNGSELSPDGRLGIQQQLKNNAEAIFRALFQEHMSSLTPLFSKLTGKVKQLYIQDLKNSSDKLEALEEAADLIPTSEWGVKINRITLGLYGRIIKEWINSLSKTYLAWSILGANSRQFAEYLSADAGHLERNGRIELAQGVDGLASFYKELAAISSYAQRRNKSLLDYLFGLPNRFENLPQIRDIESVKERMLQKISYSPIQPSAAQIHFEQTPSGLILPK